MSGRRLQTNRLAARIVLKQLLGGYLDLDPAGLKLSYDSSGRPHVSGHRLAFNASHSGDVALFAFSRSWRVGVDVEAIRPFGSEMEIARQYFSPGEIAHLESLPEATQLRAFFECWTAKEAYVKGRGGGLSIPLDSFEMTQPRSRDCVFFAEPHNAVLGWSARLLDPCPGYTAAVAVESRQWNLKCFQTNG